MEQINILKYIIYGLVDVMKNFHILGTDLWSIFIGCLVISLGLSIYYMFVGGGKND